MGIQSSTLRGKGVNRACFRDEGSGLRRSLEFRV